MELVKRDVEVTSMQIAEFGDRTHANIMKLIKKEFSQIQMDSATFRNTYTDKQGKEREMFILPKKEMLFIVSKFDADLRWSVLTRLEEIEAESVINIPAEYIKQFLPTSSHGEENKKGMLKTEPVSGYWRADMRKEENQLMQKRHEMSKMLNGLMREEIETEIEYIDAQLLEIEFNREGK